MGGRPQAMLRVVLRDDGQFEIHTWDGKTRVCAPAMLGMTVTGILQDPKLPPLDVVSNGAAGLEDLCARFVLAPEDREFAGPTVAAAKWAMSTLVKLFAPTPEVATQSSARPTTPDPPPSGRAHRVYRRGHRVL